MRAEIQDKIVQFIQDSEVKLKIELRETITALEQEKERIETDYSLKKESMRLKQTEEIKDSRYLAQQYQLKVARSKRVNIFNTHISFNHSSLDRSIYDIRFLDQTARTMLLDWKISAFEQTRFPAFQNLRDTVSLIVNPKYGKQEVGEIIELLKSLQENRELMEKHEKEIEEIDKERRDKIQVIESEINRCIDEKINKYILELRKMVFEYGEIR